MHLKKRRPTRWTFQPLERYGPEVMKPKLPSLRKRTESRSRQKLTRVSMSNANTRRDKVFSMDRSRQSEGPRPFVIAHDTETQRIIIGVAGQRLAFDFSTRVTELKPGTGDVPASVSILTQRMEKGDGEEAKRTPIHDKTKEST